MIRVATARWWLPLPGLLLVLSGCANSLAFFASVNDGPLFRDPGLAPQAALSAVVPGQSTRADLVRVLGPASTVRFAGGDEIWAWRGRAPGLQEGRAEFIVLLGPDGVVRRVRVQH